jgi:hypothetical protein
MPSSQATPLFLAGGAIDVGEEGDLRDAAAAQALVDRHSRGQAEEVPAGRAGVSPSTLMSRLDGKVLSSSARVGNRAQYRKDRRTIEPSLV